MKKLLATVETVAAVLLLLVALLTAANVGLRGLTNGQIPDWFDGSKLLMGMALFWGIAVATYHGGHICVDILWEHLRAPARRGLDVLAALISAAFLAPLAWMVVTKALAGGTQATSDLRLPLMPFHLLAAIGGVAAAVFAAVRMWEFLRGTRSEGERVEP